MMASSTRGELVEMFRVLLNFWTMFEDDEKFGSMASARTHKSQVLSANLQTPFPETPLLWILLNFSYLRFHTN